MITAHTPGPWQLDDESEIHKEGVIIASVMMPDDFICTEDDPEFDEVSKFELECQANARLIAAAPSLLEACRMCIEDCQCAQRCDGPNQDCPCWYCRTCAAIAKATGQLIPPTESIDGP